MPTFKTNHTRKTGTLIKNDDSNDYLFSSISKDKEGAKELRHLDSPKQKIILDNQNILIYCKNGWTKISLSNVKEDETWTGWDNYFKSAKLLKTVLMGYDDKNEKFVSAMDNETGNMIIAFGKEIISCKDENLTMAVIQRYNSSSSRFDVTWCLHSENKLITSTFDKNQYDNVLKHLFEITEHVYDAGAESYNWKNFIKVQNNQGGDENDWRGVFAPLTDEEEEEEEDVDKDFSPESEEEDTEEEEEEEDVWDDEEETDESSEDELLLESDSETDEDDIEGCEEEYEPRPKRRRL